MTDHAACARRRCAVAAGTASAPWLLAAGAFMIVISPVVLFAGAGNPPCQVAVTGPLPRRFRARGSRPRTARRGTP